MGSGAPTLQTVDRILDKGPSGRLATFLFSLKRDLPKRAADYAKPVARLAVFVYLLGFAIDLNINVLLIWLACCSIAAVWLGSGERRHPPRSRVVWLVALFLLVAALSILLSEDVARSLRLSAPLIPAALLFFLIYEYFDDARDLRHLYACLTITALGLAVALLWTALRAPGVPPNSWVRELGSPILIVPNDVTFLAVIAPFALALAYHEPRSAVGRLALLSLALSLCAAAVYVSRTATLALLASTICTAAALGSRRLLGALLVGLVMVLTAGYLLDLPLSAKFSETGLDADAGSQGRLRLWTFAWAMFMDAPLLGQGLHTFADERIPWAHSLYLQSLAEQGIVGLLALLLLLSYATLAAWKAARSPVRDQRILAAGALGALAGFCLASVFELALLREWVAIAMFVLLAVVARVPSLATEV
jgi:O-antigen ligase